MNRLVLFISAALLACAASAIELTEEQRTQIQERIQPVGETCLVGDADCAGPATAAAGEDDGGGDVARSGEEVYNAACMACHDTGAAGAPKLGDADAWADGIARGMEALYDAGLNGVPGTSMMAKGGCTNCTDDEVRAAVDYMVESVQ